MRKSQGRFILGSAIRFDEVDLRLDERTDPFTGVPVWTGELSLPNNLPAQLLHEYRGPHQLQLSDGRRGEIMIEQVIRRTRQFVVTFRGISPLRKSK